MAEMAVTPEQVEEERRLRYLRALVDLTANLIMQGRLDRTEADEFVEATRRQILQLFPDGESTYDLIYRPRFERLVREYAVERARVLPFRKRGEVQKA